jgi:hypothetical protein
MLEKNRESLKRAMMECFEAALDNGFDKLCERMGTALLDHDGETEFKYKVGVGLQIEPRGKAVSVKCRIGGGHRWKAKTQTVGFDAQPECAGEDGRPIGKGTKRAA